MKRSRFIQLVCVIAILSGAGVALWMIWPTPGIHPAAFERIQPGMTEADVYTILGGPPRSPPGNNPSLHFMRTRNERWGIWRAEHFAIAVYFSHGGRVVEKDYAHDESVDLEPFIDKLLRWLGMKPSRQKVRE